MDGFKIPRKVNRHVLKAINHLTQLHNKEYALTYEIQQEAKYTMRNLNPIANLDGHIIASLNHLALLGILKRRKMGREFAICGREKHFMRKLEIGDQTASTSTSMPHIRESMNGCLKNSPLIRKVKSVPVLKGSTNNLRENSTKPQNSEEITFIL